MTDSLLVSYTELLFAISIHSTVANRHHHYGRFMVCCGFEEQQRNSTKKENESFCKRILLVK
ncbi:CLUMA_CG007868, isoform A [Clunio marinus]|uniref:CLUMA_CG007868, isoform A n=1 Tax=Clunio marinus TaxID=568069 RepID=A0A1J1I3L4_9DIPT|nr:CLUMA_CG007868, isoform A [Clunio marinus]